MKIFKNLSLLRSRNLAAKLFFLVIYSIFSAGPHKKEWCRMAYVMQGGSL
jgi:hypothetical protein